MSLPTPVSVGDVVGLHFPSAQATWAHCGLIVRRFDGIERAQILAKKGQNEKIGSDLFMAVMISHGAPPKGEHSELLYMDCIHGTTLDRAKVLYVCYHHFDVFFLPGDQRKVSGAGGNYMGNIGPVLADYYYKQLLAVRHHRNKGGLRPQNVIKG